MMRSGRTKLTLGIAAIVAALLMLTPLFSGHADAHASLVRANPANNETLQRAPARVVLNFSEPIEQKLTKVEVLDRDDGRVDEGDIAFDDRDPTFVSVGLKDLQPGLYYVHWTNVSRVDGHQLRGSYPFIILNPDGTFPEGVTLDNASEAGGATGLLPKNVDSALKWISLLSLATAAGMAFFLAVVLRPAARFLDDQWYQDVVDAGERWVVNAAHVLLPASFICAAFLVLLTVSRFETSTGLWSYLTSVRAGQYRGLGLLLVLVALAGADLLFLGRSRLKRDLGLGVLMLASAGAMLMYSMVSHSATDEGKVWSITSDFVHLAASAAWLGALATLPLLMRSNRAGPDEAHRFLFLANAFDRFSIVAGLSVIAVLTTGVFNGLVEIPAWSGLTDTTYGRVLLVKLGIVLPLLGIAGLNAFILKPRLVGAIDGLYQEGGTTAPEERPRAEHHLAWLRRWLPRTIFVEVALVVAVFAAVAVLTQTSTAEGEIAQKEAAGSQPAKFSQTVDVDGLKLTLTVTPNRVGINEYTLIVQDAAGAPLDTITQARLRFSYDDVPDLIAPSELVLNRFGAGDYRSSGAYFTQPGNWRVDVGLRRSDGDDIARAFVLPVIREERATGATGGDAFALPFDSLTWNEVAGALLVLGGVVLVIYRRDIARLPGQAHRIGMTVAALALVAGGVLAFGVDQHGKAIDPRQGNPIAPTEESVARGKELFQQNCIACHGVDGRGDGPAAAELNPPPTDFRLHIPLHTDPQFYAFIAGGYPGSAMPQYKDQFSEEDIWNLVNYLRTAFNEAPSQ